MALAENRAYDYNREYLRDLPIENPQIQVVKKNQEQRKDKKHICLAYCLFLLCLY